MIFIRTANEEDIPLLHQLAEEIWWPTYSPILSPDQIAFMLGNIYSAQALKTQMDEGNTFLLFYENEVAKGFAAFSKSEKPATYKLQKLYLHPSQQGKGSGKLLINEVEKRVKQLGAKKLILNVHRKNKAKQFYEKMDYQILEELDIPYHQYVLNDFIMGKDLSL